MSSTQWSVGVKGGGGGEKRILINLRKNIFSRRFHFSCGVAEFRPPKSFLSLGFKTHTAVWDVFKELEMNWKFD